MDLDAGHACVAERDGQSQTLKERKIDMHVECFRFEGSKTIRRGSQLLANGLQVVQRLLQTEVFEIVAECFQAEKSGELLVHAQYGIFAAGPEDVMAVLDLFKNALQLAT
jgi:hypothetical protein